MGFEYSEDGGGLWGQLLVRSDVEVRDDEGGIMIMKEWICGGRKLVSIGICQWEEVCGAEGKSMN